MVLPRLAGMPFAALPEARSGLGPSGSVMRASASTCGGVERALEVVAVEMRFTALARQAKPDA